MKKLFISMLAVAALASCSQEDVIVADKGDLIGFNSFVENSTRATDTTYGAEDGQTPLEAFNLYGTVTGTNGTINIYNGCSVTGDVGAAVWSCPVQQYWITDAVYDFAAVVDATVAQDGYKMPTTLTTVANADMNFSDMLYAQKLDYKALASGNPTVQFAFEHLLAKAMFTVTSNTEGGYYYSVKDIKVNNFESGVYTIAYTDTDKDGKDDGAWVGNNKTDISFGNVEKVTKANTDGMTCAKQKLLVPTTDSFTVSCTIELWNDNGDAEDVKLGTENKTFPVAQDLVKGNSYNFTLALTVGQPIQFTVTEQPDWNEDVNNDDKVDANDNIKLQ